MGAHCTQPLPSNFPTPRNPIPQDADTTLDFLLSLQGAVRCYLAWKRIQVHVHLFAEPEYDDPVGVVDFPYNAEAPPLTTAATDTLNKLLPFEYDLDLVGVTTKPAALLADGSLYTGQWHGSRRLGRGLCRTKAGGLLEGYWCSGLHYRGRVVYPNGDFFEGEFRHMQRHGKGNFIAANEKRTYKGEWRMDEKCGIGEETYEDGSVYTGYFERGMKEGKGVLRFLNGECYDGDFVRGMRHGRGTYTWGATKYYDGEWAANVFSGYGTLVEDANRYDGTFRDGRKHGRGRLEWSGMVYEGEFHSGKMHGEGWLTEPEKGRRLFRFETNRRMEELPWQT